MFHLLPILAVVLYLLASAFYILRLFFPRSISAHSGRVMLILGFLFQISALAATLIDPELRIFGTLGGSIPGFPLTLALISSLLVFCFLMLEKRLSISSLGAFVGPLASAFMLFSGLLFHLERPVTEPYKQDLLLWFHIALTILGHVAFVFAFGVSLALILQETLIKRKRFTSVQKVLPSIRLLDFLNARLLFVGFLCMLIGVLAGFAFGAVHHISLLDLGSRVFWSLITLLVYAVLLTARAQIGLRGRRAALLSVIGFGTVVASFLSGMLINGGFHAH